MPNALGMDLRELAKQLWFQGLKAPEISQKIGVCEGTIKTWSKRGLWVRLQTTVKALSEPNVNVKVREISEVLQDNSISRRVKSRLSEVIESDLAVIALKTVTTPAQALKRQADLQPLVANSKVVLGWNDADSERPLVNITMLNPSAGDHPMQLNDSPAIDVESLPIASTLAQPMPNNAAQPLGANDGVMPLAQVRQDDSFDPGI